MPAPEKQLLAKPLQTERLSLLETLLNAHINRSDFDTLSILRLQLQAGRPVPSGHLQRWVLVFSESRNALGHKITLFLFGEICFIRSADFLFTSEVGFKGTFKNTLLPYACFQMDAATGFGSAAFCAIRNCWLCKLKLL